jgi:hypothetical protein
MPIRRSPNGARHTPPQPGRDRPEQVVAINRNAWSQSNGISGRNHPVRAVSVKKYVVSVGSAPYQSCGNTTLPAPFNSTYRKLEQ